MRKNTKLWTILTSISAFFMVFFIVGYIVASYNAVTINWFFNITTSTTVGGSGEDAIYYPSAFTKKGADGKTLLDSKGKEVYDDAALSAAGDELCREVAEEGIVLLKNNGALPLAASSTVSVFGQSAAHPITSGTGSGATSGSNGNYKTSMELGGLKLNEDSLNFYTSGDGKGYRASTPGMHDNKPFVIGECPWSVIAGSSSYAAMTKADTALVVFSRNGGEGYDLANGSSAIGYDFGEIMCSDALTKEQGSLTGNNYLELNADERSVLAGLKTLKDSGTIKNIVVVLNSANAMQLDFLEKDICGIDYGIDACLWVGAPGQSGINAIGSILSGKVNPSGRLVDTYCYDNLREPSIYNFGHNAYTNFDSDYAAKADAEGEGSDVKLNEKYYNVYREGIYVGYRYYETRYEDYVLGNTDSFNYGKIVANSFGNGLSYTTFDYSKFSVKDNGDGTMSVSVTVTNTGSVAGKEVVEVYAQTPYSDYAKQNKIEKAAIELVGYEKTNLLEPGKSQEMTVTIEKELLASYDAFNAKTYVMDAGKYYLTVGTGAHDALNNILREKGADESKIVEAQKTYTSGESLVYSWDVTTTDTTTYSKSSSTGAAITNQFDNADLNYYDNGSQSITYVSRSDWRGTFDDTSLATMQATKVVLKMTDKMYNEVKNNQYTAPAEASSAKMPTMKADNGLKLIDFRGVPADGTITKNGKTYTWDDLLDQLSFVDMRDLIIMGQHTTRVIASIGKPGTSDQNGPCGFSAAFVGGGSGTAFPVSPLRAATWNKELAKRIGEIIGEDGLHSGCNGLYGPAANTHRNAYCGRNFEYYSEDPMLASSFGAEEVKGIQSKGIIVYEKHFALNDSESHREGVGTWACEQAIREIYLEAFRNIMKIDGGNAHAAMSGFNRFGTIWAGDSNELMNNVLRGEWGFDGFVVTDMDNCNGGVLCTAYMYAPRAVTSGTDLYDGNNNHKRDAQLNAYKNDAYVVSCMRRATFRICYNVANSAAMNGVSSATEVVEIMPWWQITLLSIMVVFIATTIGSGTMLALNATGKIEFPKSKKD